MNSMNHVDVSAVDVSLDELKQITGGQEIRCQQVTLSHNGDGTTTAKCD